jgi:stearoyl-CoA 9-desaturase NADPH oxidoreductase
MLGGYGQKELVHDAVFYSTGASTGMTAAGSLRHVVLRRVAVPLLEALTAPHGADRYLEMVNPLWSLRDVRAEIVEVRRAAVGRVTLLLRHNANWAGFRAGQHVALTVDIDGVRRTRCYSLACSPHRQDGLLEITVAAEPDGLVSGHLNNAAGPGTVVRLSQAQGGFLLPDDRPEHILLISGGSGITPVMSMLRTLCQEGYCAENGPGRVTFLHYARSAEHVAYADELTQLAARHGSVRLLRSYTRAAGGELSGRFEPSHLPRLDERTSAWVCGPAGLVDDVRAHWEREAVAAPLQTEQFTAPAPAVPADDGEIYGQVSFSRSGRRTDNTGAPLLEQAEALGLRPEFGCRMGICLTCTSHLTSGNVRNVYTGEVCSEPDSEIQICSTVPIGDVTVEL